jgi:histidine phosphotransferase ChpT
MTASPFDDDRTELASLLASRLCHDFISPASAIVSGLDLLDDPDSADMRDDAMALIAASAKKLVDSLQFSRVAYGGGSGAETFGAPALKELAEGMFAHHRGELNWAVELGALEKPAARALLNLCALAAAALPMGGTATVTAENADDGGQVLRTVSAGRRARLRPELLAGLLGEGPGDGLPGHWIQAAWTHALVRRAGGEIGVEQEEDRVALTARLPAQKPVEEEGLQTLP